ncbi:beta/gamma crystallin-related protein [Aquidulcibacter paucihalophilus]|uniref:beta/gamma crystallin-related protein n=1 Tax=Aquidulcibacter paucihalophilus TaxID=1978549 RepID=UPI0018E30C80|nr:beta/gamma crystallin-related protein [Aquidulcibacter paucihalophilus]
MKKALILALAGLTTLANAPTAEAQRFDRSRPSITLYAGTDFRGQAVTITGDVPDLRQLNFDEAAGSLIARGDWQVCLDPDYGSRCRTYCDRIPNLESFKGRISSVRYIGRGGFGNPGFGGGFGGGGFGPPGGGYTSPPRYNGQTTTGRATVFFPGTISQGQFGGRADANQFCRDQGLRDAVYSGQDRNGNLEDVLCRR